MLTRYRRPAVLAAGLVVLALAPAAAEAAGRAEAPPAPLANGQPVPGEVLVGFEHGASGSERAAARRSADVSVKRALGVRGVQLVTTARGETVAATIARLERDPNVRFAEPNRWRTASATIPNDPRFGELWGLDNSGQSVNDASPGTPDKDIDAPEAWDVFTGGNTLVAVVDEGVAYDHPDLAPNMWTNPGEIAGNGVDDDGNGYADDVHGFDVIDDDSDPRDFGGHGTHVAGTIAARGNDGAGVVGVSWTAQLMAVRALGPTGGTDADIAEGFEYAADNGARVVNASLGGPGFSNTLRAPILGHPNTLFVVAAGNDGDNLDPVSATSEYPCSFTDANVICVAATDQDDALADFSNFGATSVDLAAPGVNILSTQPDRDDVVFSDGFEANDFATRWNAHVDRGTTSAWGRTGTNPGAGSFSIADSPTGNYANNSDSYVDMKTPVSFAGKHGCIAAFKVKADVVAGDQFTVDLSTNGGGTWLRQFGESGTTNGEYRTITVELDADGAPSVLIGFGIETNASGVGDGVSLDDVTLRCIRPEQGAGSFGFLDGTSMATPHVAGAAALLIGRKPSLTVAQVRSALLDTGDIVPSLVGKTVTGRRLNVNNAIRSPALAVPPSATTGAASGVTTSTAVLSGTVNPRSTATSYQFEFGTTAAYGSATTAGDAGAGAGDQAVSGALGGLSPSTTYHYRLVAIRGGDRFPGADATFTTAAPPVVGPGGGNQQAKTLRQRIKKAKVACTRERGKYRCKVSLTREGGLKVKLVARRGKKVVGRGSGRVGKRITLKGKKAKAGRIKVKLTFSEGTKKASITKRVRVR